MFDFQQEEGFWQIIFVLIVQQCLQRYLSYKRRFYKNE